MSKKKPPQDTPPKQPTGPTLKQVHGSGEILIPGGRGRVIQFGPPGRVTQEELFDEEFYYEQAEIALRKWVEIRFPIQKRLDAGARIEPGERAGVVTETTFLKHLDTKKWDRP